MSIQETMDDFLEMLKEQTKECPHLMELFTTCYTNTLDTTVKRWKQYHPCHYRGYSCHVAAGFRCPAASVHLSGEGK